MKTYRTDDREGMRIYTARELEGMQCIYHPVSEPQDERQPFGEWYCDNSDCVIRQVEVACKLKFHHWRKVECLLRVEP